MINKKLTAILFIIIFSVVTVSALAQQEKTGVLKKEEGQGIETGQVIAFGELISPPYFVTYENGKILINGIVFCPRAQDPGAKTNLPEVTSLDVKKHNLINTIRSKFVEYYNLHGLDNTRKIINSEFSSDPIIKELKIKESGDNYSIRVTFADGDSSNIGFLNYNFRNSHAEKMLPPSSRELEKNNTEYLNYIRSVLKKGSLLCFGFEYTTVIAENKKDEVINVLEKYRENDATYEHARDNLEKYMGGDVANFLDDIKKSN